MVVCYCSKGCQLEHWPHHKRGCGLMQRERRENKHRRDFRLFMRWTDKAFGVFGILCCYELRNGKTKKKRQQIDPSKEVFQFEVDFDYNALIFLPITPAKQISLESLTKHQLSLVKAKTNAGMSPTKRRVVVVALVKYKSSELAVSIHPEMDLKITWDDNMNIFDEPIEWIWPYCLNLSFSLVRLKSNRIEQLLQLDEREKMFTNFMMSVFPLFNSEKFVSFLLNALHLTSEFPRHRSHTVVIHFTIGSGLGQIESINSFDVLEAMKICSLMLARYNYHKDIFPEVAEDGLPQVSNFLSSKGGTTGSDFMIPVGFAEKSRPAHVFFPQKPVRLEHGAKIWAAYKRHKCDQAAKKFFNEMKEVKFHQVKSPNLNA
jgi:hypothetical protein